MDFILLPEPNLSTRVKDTYHSLETVVRTRVQSVATNWKLFRPKAAFSIVLLALFVSLSTASVLALTVSLSSLLIDEAKMSPAAAWGCVAGLFIAVAVGSLFIAQRILNPKEVAEDLAKANSAVKHAERDFQRNLETLEHQLSNTVAEAQEKALHTADEVRTAVHRLAPAQQVRQHPWGAVAAAALVGILAVRK